MHLFKYKKGELYAEDVPLRTLAAKYGTPLYVYSQGTLERHVKSYHNAFDGFPHVVCFAVKANSNIAVLNVLGKKGTRVSRPVTVWSLSCRILGAGPSHVRWSSPISRRHSTPKASA